MSGSSIQKLRTIMAQLRDPENGCPWDLEQSFESIVPHTLEEAYEVAEAIESQDMSALKEELGDLLLQVVFYAQMAEEQKLFNFDDVAESICEKLVRRHPHIYGKEDIKTAEQQLAAWEAMKEQERKAKRGNTLPGALDDLPLALPALTRAQKLQKRAAKVGFDWKDIAPVIEKIEEEIAELKAAYQQKQKGKIHEELGDLLFAIVNLARHSKVEAEEALRSTNRKFETRFKYIENKLAQKKSSPAESTLEEMDTLWNEAKLKAL